MADLTLRNVKGSPLTNQEVDDNFSNLNTDKWSQDNTKISNWDTAYSWGDHAAVGYLTSFTETDPTVPAHVKSITTTNISNWNTAYNWGNHASVGYLTSASLTGYATQTYVNTAVSNLVDSAPATLDTLNELAAALGDDPNFATTVTNSLAAKISNNVGATWTATGSNALRFQSTDTIDSGAGALASLEVYQDTSGADAFMAFHVGGDYAAYFGLHGGINDFVVGGWSKGATYQRVFHDGYHPNADTLTTARTIALGGDVTGSASFNGSSNITITATVADDSHNHIISNVDGLQTALDGKLSTSGKAADSDLLDGFQLDGATSVATRIFNNKGQTHSTYTNFNTIMTPGPNYLQGGANGPTGVSSQQYYGFMLGLGVDYGTSTGSSGHYASQMYYPRASRGESPYLYFRDMESGAWGGWRKVYAGFSDTAATWATARTITLGGDLSGSVSINGGSDVTLTATVADDSHNHIISNVDGLQTALDGKLALTGGILTGTIEQSYSDTIWSHSEGTVRPVSRLIHSEVGSIGTTGVTITDVYGEADLAAIDNQATFTYADAWDAVESHGGRLPTLAELMDGVGSGSGQSYDGELLWTCTPAGPHHVWVARGAYLSSPTRQIVDIKNPANVYRTRAFFDVSRDGKNVSYDHDGLLRIEGSNRAFHDGYHPNADALTTARTISLSNNASGSVSFSGSSNVSISTSLVPITINSSNDANILNDGIFSFNKNNPSNVAADYGILFQFTENQSQQLLQTYGGASNKVSLYGRRKTGGTWDTVWTQYFSDHYHPNADTWTTARTITLGGDLSGSVSMNGGSNVTLTATVSDDSHNHIISNVDGLQTELDGKLAITGGTLTGNLTVQGSAGFNSGGETASVYIGDSASEIRATYNGGTQIFVNAVSRVEIEGGTGNLNVKTGAIEMAGTTVIDASRNLTNIGNIQTGNNEIRIDGGGTRTRKIVMYDAGLTNNNQFYGLGVEGSSFINSIYSATDTFYWYAGVNSTTRSLAGSLSGTGVFNAVSGYQVNGTTVIDASRNLTNINLVKFREHSASFYISPTDTNTLNAQYDSLADTADMWINYRGYQDGFTKFRDFRVGNGKGTALLFVDGSANSFDFQNSSVIQMGGTTVIDASRNLTNIGTGSFSGTVTSTRNSGNFIAQTSSDPSNYYAKFEANYNYGQAFRIAAKGAGAEHYIMTWGDGAGLEFNGGSTSIIKFSGDNLSNIGTISSGAITATSYTPPANSTAIYNGYNGVPLIVGVSGAAYFHGSDNAGYGIVIQGGHPTCKSVKIGAVNAGVTVIDASRNLTNIGTISSGDITATNILPPTDNTGVVGSAAQTWNNGQFTNLTVDSTLTVRAAIDLADSDQLRMGSSDDFKIYYDGSANEIEFEMEATCNQIRIHDNGTTRFTLARATGTFTATGNVTAYSDERLKDNIETLDGSKVLEMRGVSFTKDDEMGSGVIAQELEKVAPELVHTADDEMGTKSVAYGNLVGYLIEAVKLQQTQIDELKAQIEEMKNGD